MQIFQRNILNKYIESLDAELIAERYQQFADYFLNAERQENIHNSKEEQFQEGFLRELFVKILGYSLNPDPDFNLTTEKKNETNSKKADGAILVNGKVVGVVELKDHKTTDLSKVEAQAFNYKSQHKEAVYVVISNFEKLRFYIDNAVDFEEFDLFHLTKEDFARLWICLAYKNIEKNLPKQIKAASLTNEDQITNALYKDYSNFKRDLFDDILKNNPTDDTEHKILLFKKTQKLLDRLLFIFFAEDRGLLPPNSIMLIVNQWEKLKELDEYQPFYNRLKKYFGYMNTGFQGKNYEVFAYNGGLFKPDEVLDSLTISDDVLRNYCQKISDYDFQSDVDVNILGHIFENSLTEIEEVTNKLQQGEAPTVSKRKKDGVFYTPQYITKYIVANTVGKLCNEKKAELGIDESEYFADKKRQVATKKALIGKLDAYRNWLLQISICDPACGSGAFLNAALDFLIAEHKLIDEMQAKVEGATIVFPNIENSILENNLYGVDINEESVEIAKLSLWLRTAKPHRKLNSLNNNIKCGNSLIDDPEIAGEKAFCWEKEFPQVFHEKQKKAWHITTAVHDSRTSARMEEYEVRKFRDKGTRPDPEPMLLSEQEEVIVTETVAQIVEEDKLNVLAYNICFDHMHLLLVCEEEEVPKIVGKIKSVTARAVNIAMGRTVPKNGTTTATAGHDPLSLPNATLAETVGHDPLSLPEEELPKKGIPQCSLWTRKYGTTYIDSEEHLYNTIEYIRSNREHHDLPPLQAKYPRCVSIDEAFRPEYTGGFDVVIGNPPYGILIDEVYKSHYTKNFPLAQYKLNLYILFLERMFQIFEKGIVSFIIPKSLLINTYFADIRRFILSHAMVTELFTITEKVFEDAEVGSSLIITFEIKKEVDLDNTVRLANCEKTIDFLEQNNIIESRQIQAQLLDSEKAEIVILSEDSSSIKSKVKRFLPALEYYKFKNGLNPGNIKDKLITRTQNELTRKIIWGKEIKRYSIVWGGDFIVYDEHIADNLTLDDVQSKKGMKQQTKIDFSLRDRSLFETKKLVIRKTGDSLICSYDDNNFYFDTLVHGIYQTKVEYSLKYILSILNSKPATFFYRCLHDIKGKVFAKISLDDLSHFPIPSISETNKVVVEEMEKRADMMLSLNADLQQKRQRFIHRLQESLGVQKITATLEHFDENDFKTFVAELKKQKVSLSLTQKDEWEDYFNQYKTDCNAISAQIAATDKEIDQMVYELYGLTEDEIRIVEGE